jgi:hypothetical protein
MSDRSLFVIHWNRLEAEEFVAPLESHGCTVRIEYEDGGAAHQAIASDRPDAVLVFLTRLPSHGRLAAKALFEDAKTRDVPIVFVGGNEWTVTQTRDEFPRAHFCEPENICDVLEPLLEC